MPEEKIQTFENVTLYLKGFGISRIDAKRVTIKTGVKYAQYDNAIEVRYLEPRQRKERQVVLTYKPFLVVMDRAAAIEPDAALLRSESSTPGVSIQKSRYSSCDPRWESDFMARLVGADVLFTTLGYNSQELR